MTDLPPCIVQPLDPSLETAVQRFVIGHPHHAPGHRRELAAVERALGHRERSLVALRGGEVVGYAPLWAVDSVRLRFWRVTSLSGAGLVSCGPLVSVALSTSEQRATLQALTTASMAAARGEGAHWLRWVLPPVAGDTPTMSPSTADMYSSLGLSVRVLTGLLVDLQQPEAALRSALSATTRRGIVKAEQRGLRSRSLHGAAAAELLGAFESEATAAFADNRNARSALRAVRAAFGPPLAQAQGDAGGSEPPSALLHLVAAGDAESAPLSAVVTCESSGLAYYFLAFNRPEAKERDANPVALWQAMLSCRARGNRWFLLGSLEHGTSKSARISAFKRKFGGEVVLSPVLDWRARPVAVALVQLLEAGVGAIRSRR